MEIRQTQSGAEAWRNGERVAFLEGRTLTDDVRGRHVWSGLEEHRLGAGESPDLYRDLYAVAGERWLADGFPDHYVVVPAQEGVLEAWAALEFARQQVHGARATEASAPAPPAGFSVRLAGPAEIESTLALAEVIYRHLQGPPVWSSVTPPPAAELRASWLEVLEAEGTAYFLAEREGEPVGHLALLRRDADTVELAVAATRENARGLGIGVALTEHALRWAHGRGYGTCVTDWRATSLLSSRFWPRRGFRPTAYRLVRRVRG